MGYFANSTEGDVLDQQCESCPLGRGCCPIRSVQILFNYDQHRTGNDDIRIALNMLIDEDNRCKLRPLVIGGKDEMGA